MEFKKLDKKIDLYLWIVFLLLCVASWCAAYHLKAPDIEIVNLESVPYTFTDEEGVTVESNYKLAWLHKEFTSPEIIFYDPIYKNKATVRDEYLPKIQAEMPSSRYKEFYHRWFWVILPVLIVLSAITVYFGGGAIRDNIMYRKLINNPNFKDCSYFLFTDRIAKSKDAKLLIPSTIGKYINTKINDLNKRYNETFVNLVKKMLEAIKKYQSTEISYSIKYKHNFVPQKEFLKEMLNIWEKRLEVDSMAPEICQKLKFQIEKWEFIEIESDVTAADLSPIITFQLNKLFKEIMGEEVFKFTNNIADDLTFHPQLVEPHELHVSINARNDIRTFTWSGEEMRDKNVPGVHIQFTISCYINGKETILWNKSLSPVSTYRAEVFDAKKFYNHMIKETVNNFDKEMQS